MKGGESDTVPGAMRAAGMGMVGTERVTMMRADMRAKPRIVWRRLGFRLTLGLGCCLIEQIPLAFPHSPRHDMHDTQHSAPADAEKPTAQARSGSIPKRSRSSATLVIINQIGDLL
jgi:hypothetical protein